jgi:hypothetical protein
MAAWYGSNGLECQRILVGSLSFGASPPNRHCASGHEYLAAGTAGSISMPRPMYEGPGVGAIAGLGASGLGRPIRSPRDESCDVTRPANLVAKQSTGIYAQAHSAYTFGSAGTSMRARWSASTATQQ